jgi:hypothetical protein
MITALETYHQETILKWKKLLLANVLFFSYCIGELFNGTRIFDSILRINGTVYSTLKFTKICLNKIKSRI